MLKLVVPIVILASPSVFSDTTECDGSSSTERAIECLQNAVNEADADMSKYLEASKKRHAADRTHVGSLEFSQDIWLKTREQRCRVAGFYPRDEAKLAAQYLYCRRQITAQRTHEIWERYLKRADAVPPALPEPGL